MSSGFAQKYDTDPVFFQEPLIGRSLFLVGFDWDLKEDAALKAVWKEPFTL